MTSVTITKGNTIIKGVKNGAVHFDLCWHPTPHLKKILWARHRHYTNSFDTQCKVA